MKLSVASLKRFVCAWSTSEAFLTRDQVLALLLGQLISLLITGTGITSQILAEQKKVNIPTGQSLLNYFLLAVVYSIPLIRRGSFWTSLKAMWKFYLPLALIDVEANYLVVKAYQYTTITSVMLLDCFTIPCVVLLTYFFLKTRYNLRHVLGILLCIAGLVSLVVTDVRNDNEGSNRLLGDVLCLFGALLYSLSNVGAEFFVKKYDRVEFMAMLGVFATLISSVQLCALTPSTACISLK